MNKVIHQEIVFKVNPHRIYDLFMNPQLHADFTGGKAEISKEAGAAFWCHDGRIEGRNIELIPNQRIVQAWRVKDVWQEGVYSIVKIELKAEGNNTRLVLDHSGVPEEKITDIESGWHKKYWEPLEKYLQSHT